MNLRLIRSRSGGLQDRRRSGQTMTETIIVVGLIAIAAIIAVGVFGGGVKQSFVNMYKRLIGVEDTSSATDNSGDVTNPDGRTKTGTFD